MKQIIISTALTILFAACKTEANKKETLPTSGEAIPVMLAAVGSSTGSHSIETTGLLSTEDESKPSFKIGGVVESVMVDEGDFVKKGQVLATLKNTEIASQVSQVSLNVQKAQRDYQRALNLYKDSVVTLEQLQNAKTGLDIAEQALSAAAFNQQYARIYAPADGFVVRKLLGAGEIAGPGTPVFVLNHVAANSSWILRCGVTDVEWASVAVGDKATVSLDAFPGKKFDATVSKRSLAADPSSGSFSIEMKVSLNGSKPAAGMFGKANIIVGQSFTAVTIPYAALLEADGDRGYVFITTDMKTVKRIPVQLGNIYQDKVEILSGLEQQQYVVVSGSAYLNDQSTIVVKK
jgi:RND family efflux transporter MFP subunit